MPGQIIASPVDAQVHGFIKKQAQRESCTVFHILRKKRRIVSGTVQDGEDKERTKWDQRKRKCCTEQQCSGSVTFLYGSGSLDPYLGLRIRILLFFGSTAFKMPTKISFFQSFLLTSFCRYRTLTSVFKDKMPLRSHKTAEIMVYQKNFAG
jgi:hypothetical protein